MAKVCCCLFREQSVSTSSAAIEENDAIPENHAITDQKITDQQEEDDEISKLTVVYEGTTYSLQGNLKTTYIEECGFFFHTIVYEKSQKNEDSVCFAMLKLGENDQFIFANEDDLTLMSHGKVLDVFRCMPIEQRISLCIARCDDSKEDISIVEYSFKFILHDFTEEVCGKYRILERRISVHVYSERPADSGYFAYNPMKRNVTILKTRTNKYLQLQEKPKDPLIFAELVSKEPVGLCSFTDCHFIEEITRIERKPKIHPIRTYKNSKNGWYMFVKPNGQLTLCPLTPQDASQGDTPTEFRLQSPRHLQFQVLEEVLGNRYMKYVNAEACFEKVKVTKIDLIDKSFRFGVDRLDCTV